VSEPWDPAKAEANLRKHGVGFPEAVTLEDDQAAWWRDDEDHSTTEGRYVVVGMSYVGRILFVACTLRHGRMRPISARRATKRERHEYWSRR
jgi:uncharacterized DUF497 family protein